MSVVNQMLKDLEKRNAEQSEGQAVYQPSERQNTQQRWMPLIAILLIVLVGVAGYAVYLLVQNNQKTDQGAPPDVVSVAQPDAAPVAAKPMAVVVPEPRKIPDDAQPQPGAITDEPAIVDTENDNVVVVVTDPVPIQAPIEQNPVDDLPEEKPVATFSKSSGTSTTGVSSLREKAAAAVKAGQETLAIELLGRLIETEPENIAARKKLAAFLYAQDDATEARVVLEQGISRFPEDASMRLMLARLLNQQNEINTAFAVLAPSSELSGVSQEYRAYRAQLAQQLGEHGIALNDYQILLNEQPESARWWLGFAIASEQLGISTQALDAYQRVVRLGQLGPDVDAFARQRAELLVGAQ